MEIAERPGERYKRKKIKEWRFYVTALRKYDFFTPVNFVTSQTGKDEARAA